MRMRWVITLSLLFCTPEAWSFDSWEHKKMGDLAYHLVLEKHCPSGSTTEMCRTLKDKGPRDPYSDGDGTQPSYGDISMCVDFFLTSEKIIADRHSGPDKIDSARDPKNGLFPSSVKAMQINAKKACDGYFRVAQASTVNHTHFQAEMLLATRTNQMLALHLKVFEQNLPSALLMNAIASHYLQDSFAPGHITTLRNNLTDVVANALHNHGNRKGLMAKVKGKAICEMISPDDRKRIRTAIENKPEHFYIVETGDIKQSGTEQRTEHIAWFEDKLCKLKGDETREVLFRGDTQLGEAAQDEQRYIMLLMQIRLIEDLLLSTATPGSDGALSIKLVDSFKDTNWEWRYTANDGKFQADPSKVLANLGPVEYAISRDSHQTTEPDPTIPKGNEIRWRDSDWVFGVNIGQESLPLTSSPSRTVVGIEALVTGAKEYNSNQGLLVGIQPYLSRGKNGVSLTGRLAWMFPQLESAASLVVKATSIGRPGAKSVWRPGGAVRIDTGFSSFLSLYVQLGVDSMLTRDNDVKSGLALGAGIQIGAPPCAYLKWCKSTTARR